MNPKAPSGSGNQSRSLAASARMHYISAVLKP